MAIYRALEDSVAVGIETVYGEPAALTLEAHSIECAGDSDLVAEGEGVERVGYLRAQLGNLSTLPGPTVYKATIKTPMKGTDASLLATTDADWDDRGVDALLRGCGHTAVKALGTRTYGMQSGSAFEACTIEMTKGPLWKRAVGCAGTYTIEAEAGNIAWFNFAMQGHFARAVEDAITGTTYDAEAVAPPTILKGSITVGTIVDQLFVSKVMFDAGNAVASRALWAPKQVPNYKVFADDGGAFTDETADSNSAAASDVTCYPSAAMNDAVYFGSRVPFVGLRIQIGTQGSTSMTVVWEYWTGAAWATLPMGRQQVVDFDEAVGTYYNEWEPPSDWDQTAVNAVTAFWVRARISAFTSSATIAQLTQVWTLLPSYGHHSFVVTDRKPKLSLVIEVEDPDLYDPNRDFERQTQRTITIPFGTADVNTWQLTATNATVRAWANPVQQNGLWVYNVDYDMTAHQLLLT